MSYCQFLKARVHWCAVSYEGLLWANVNDLSACCSKMQITELHVFPYNKITELFPIIRLQNYFLIIRWLFSISEEAVVPISFLLSQIRSTLKREKQVLSFKRRPIFLLKADLILKLQKGTHPGKPTGSHRSYLPW